MSTMKPEQFFDLNVVHLKSLAVSPCELWLAIGVMRWNADVTDYVCDIWRVSLDIDTKPLQLTSGNHNDNKPCFRKDGSLGFLSDRPPSISDTKSTERATNQVWLLPIQGGDPQQLTTEPNGVSDFMFAARSELLVVNSRIDSSASISEQTESNNKIERSETTKLHYTEMPVRNAGNWISTFKNQLIAFISEGGNRSVLTSTFDYCGGSFDLSPDGTTVVAVMGKGAFYRNSKSSLVLIDVESGKMSLLYEDSQSEIFSPKFSVDGHRIAFEVWKIHPGVIGKSDIWLIDLETGNKQILTEHWDRHDYSLFAWSSDNSSIIFSVPDEGQKPIFIVNVETHQVEQINTRSSGGSHVNLHHVNQKNILVGIRSSFTQPWEPFSIKFEPNSKPKLLANMSGYNKENFTGLATVESIIVTSDDGTPVQSYYVKPNQRSQKNPLPAIVAIHGGPIHSWCDEWYFDYNPLISAAHGFASILTNPRGSTGFGQFFLEGISGNVWGAQCYKDIMAVTESFSTREDIDGQKLAAFGTSFGGYMVNWIGGNTNLFCCLVSKSGIFSIPAFIQTTDVPGYWHWILDMKNFTADNIKASNKYSPHFHLSNWTSPTLIAHGEKDYRVPVTESLGLFEGLQRHNIDSELIIFPKEGHGIGNAKTLFDWRDSMYSFLKKHMR